MDNNDVYKLSAIRIANKAISDNLAYAKNFIAENPQYSNPTGSLLQSNLADTSAASSTTGSSNTQQGFLNQNPFISQANVAQSPWGLTFGGAVNALPNMIGALPPGQVQQGAGAFAPYGQGQPRFMPLAFNRAFQPVLIPVPMPARSPELFNQWQFAEQRSMLPMAVMMQPLMAMLGELEAMMAKFEGYQNPGVRSLETALENSLDGEANPDEDAFAVSQADVDAIADQLDEGELTSAQLVGGLQWVSQEAPLEAVDEIAVLTGQLVDQQLVPAQQLLTSDFLSKMDSTRRDSLLQGLANAGLQHQDGSYNKELGAWLLGALHSDEPVLQDAGRELAYRMGKAWEGFEDDPEYPAIQDFLTNWAGLTYNADGTVAPKEDQALFQDLPMAASTMSVMTEEEVVEEAVLVADESASEVDEDVAELVEAAETVAASTEALMAEIVVDEVEAVEEPVLDLVAEAVEVEETMSPIDEAIDRLEDVLEEVEDITSTLENTLTQ